MEKTKNVEKNGQSQFDQLQPSTEYLGSSGEVGLFVELGQPRPTEIKELKRGVGVLSDQIKEAVTHWREELRIGDDVEVVPVVVLYRRDRLK
jgi:hypothetical protein